MGTAYPARCLVRVQTHTKRSRAWCAIRTIHLYRIAVGGVVVLTYLPVIDTILVKDVLNVRHYLPLSAPRYFLIHSSINDVIVVPLSMHEMRNLFFNSAGM